jgi:hypothetical protein
MQVPVPKRLAVTSCIGCGMVEAPRDCIGTCYDRRVELVHVASHNRLLGELHEERRRGDVFAALVARVAAAEPAAGGWEAAYRQLQAAARAAVYEAGPALEPSTEEDDVVSGWWCASCGRLDAPQQCLGICVHRPDELVRDDVHAGVAAEAAAARLHAAELGALARRAAWSTPRAGHWEDSGRALVEEARRLVGHATSAADVSAAAALG